MNIDECLKGGRTWVVKDGSGEDVMVGAALDVDLVEGAGLDDVDGSAVVDVGL